MRNADLENLRAAAKAAGLGHLNDADLLAEVRRGTAGAFETFYCRHGRLLRGIVGGCFGKWKWTGVKAEEIESVALEAAWRAARSADPARGNVIKHVTARVRSRILDDLRGVARYCEHFAPRGAQHVDPWGGGDAPTLVNFFIHEGDITPEERCDNPTARVLELAWEVLPDQQAHALELGARGKPDAFVAELLGCTAAYVRALRSRAHKRLEQTNRRPGRHRRAVRRIREMLEAA